MFIDVECKHPEAVLTPMPEGLSQQQVSEGLTLGSPLLSLITIIHWGFHSLPYTSDEKVWSLLWPQHSSLNTVISHPSVRVRNVWNLISLSQVIYSSSY